MKQCSKCKEWKDESEFYKHIRNKNGLTARCKICHNLACKQPKKIKIVIEGKKQCPQCKEFKNYEDFHKDKSTKYGLVSRCKVCVSKLRKKISLIKIIPGKKQCTICSYYKDYSEFSKCGNRLQCSCKSCQKQWRTEHKEQERLRSLRWRQTNAKEIAIRDKTRRDANKEQERLRGFKKNRLPAKYSNYSVKLTVDEAPRLAQDGISLEVKCKYCGKYFIPNNSTVIHRIQALKGQLGGDLFLYCSNKCKQACPIYGKVKYPELFKIDTSREVQAELRQMVFELDGWECQRCGATTQEVELHCHHLTGVELNPIESADVDNCITLCEFHHGELHKRKGCTYNDFRRKACVTEEN